MPQTLYRQEGSLKSLSQFGQQEKDAFDHLKAVGRRRGQEIQESMAQSGASISGPFVQLPQDAALGEKKKKPSQAEKNNDITHCWQLGDKVGLMCFIHRGSATSPPQALLNSVEKNHTHFFVPDL